MPRAPLNRASVMISSTFRDLVSLRQALIDELVKARLLPIVMEHSVPGPNSEIIGNSLEMVEDATAYIGIISLRYGQVLTDPRNPDNVSVTRLEYERARALGRPTLMFIMDDTYPTPMKAKTATERRNLAAFRDRARENGKLCQHFATEQEFLASLGQIVVKLRDEIDAASPLPPAEEWQHGPAASPTDLAALTLHAPEPYNAAGTYRLSASADFGTIARTDKKGRTVVIGLARARLRIELEGFNIAKDSLIGKRTPHDHVEAAVNAVDIKGPTTGTPAMLKGDPFTDEHLAVLEPGPAGPARATLALTADPVNDLEMRYAPGPGAPPMPGVPARARKAILAAILRDDLPKARLGTEIVLDARSIKRRLIPR